MKTAIKHVELFILISVIIGSNTMLAEDALQKSVWSWLVLTGYGRVAATVEVGDVVFYCVLICVFLYLVLSHRRVSGCTFEDAGQRMPDAASSMVVACAPAACCLLPVAFDGVQVDVRVPENVELQGFHFEFFVS